MPIFKIQCDDCGFIEEHFLQSYNDPNPICTLCESKNTNRLLSHVAISIDGHCSIAKDIAIESGSNNNFEKNSGGLIRIPEYADKNTGKSLGLGVPEIIKN